MVFQVVSSLLLHHCYGILGDSLSFSRHLLRSSMWLHHYSYVTAAVFQVIASLLLCCCYVIPEGKGRSVYLNEHNLKPCEGTTNTNCPFIADIRTLFGMSHCFMSEKVMRKNFVSRIQQKPRFQSIWWSCSYLYDVCSTVAQWKNPGPSGSSVDRSQSTAQTDHSEIMSVTLTSMF